MYFGFAPVFTVPAFDYGLSLADFPAFTALGLVTAVTAVLFVRFFYLVRGLFRDWRIPRALKPAIGGMLTGIIAIAVPPVLGEGSFGLQNIISGNFPLALLVLCCIGKMAATSLSIGSGGSGGVFGPSLFVGAALGGVFGSLYLALFPGSPIPLTVFILLGMVGFFSGAANAPVSTVIIVAEMTHTFSLLAPFIWVSSFGFLFSQRWDIYENQLPLAENVLADVVDDQMGRNSCGTAYSES